MVHKYLMKNIRFICLLALSSLWLLQLSGCATGMALLETGAESVNPTIMATLDSFESGSLAIKTSNRIMMEVPISEQTQWQDKLSGKVSGEAGLKMGGALFGSSQGVTIATEVDPESGFPRPTSAFYHLIKERNKMLDQETSEDDVKYFKGKKATVIYRDLGPNKPPVYRNLLMAYGTVMNNKDEVSKFQQKLELTSKGFKECDAWVKTSTKGSVEPTACKDPALKDETFKLTEVKKGADEKADLEKKYGTLANKIYSASFAGADFSTACAVKLASAIVNGIRALPNAANEFKGLKGSYNVAMLLPRIKNLIASLGFYSDNLGVQLSAYKTMYQQIKGTYEIKEEDPKKAQQTKAALLRMEQADRLLAAIEPKLRLATAGRDVEFTNDEVGKLNLIAAQYPIQSIFEKKFMAALGQVVQP